MKDILKIYSKYKIMPSLGLHQLRVAAVAEQICNSIPEIIDKDSIITACMFHDMGNIIKSNLAYFPEFLEPEGMEYWQKTKDEFIKKYGDDEHIATKIIAEEIGLTEIQKSYIEAIGFSKISQTLSGGSLEQKICCYSDQRVGPYGVVTIEERIIDGKKRYEGIINKVEIFNQRESLISSLRKLETEIFKNSSILPSNITNESINNTLNKLKSN